MSSAEEHISPRPVVEMVAGLLQFANHRLRDTPFNLEHVRFMMDAGRIDGFGQMPCRAGRRVFLSIY